MPVKGVQQKMKVTKEEGLRLIDSSRKEKSKMKPRMRSKRGLKH